MPVRTKNLILFSYW